MSASENPDRSDSDKTMGSLTNISKDIGVLASLSKVLGPLVHKNSRAALRHEEVDGLNDSTENELDPEVPIEKATCLLTIEVEAQHNKSNTPLLFFRLEKVSDHADRDTATSRAKAAQESGYDQTAKRDLEDRPSSELLTPGRPKLATKGVGDEEDHLPHAGGLFADAFMDTWTAKMLDRSIHFFHDGQVYPRWSQASISVMIRLPSSVYFSGTDDLRRLSLELPTPSSTPFSRSRARSLLDVLLSR
ncbi:hypothetical protein KC349_g15 [Hortaea werneckii]|nr:hypothetical protein KC349_g15 [Hortaea werneckii]